MNAWPFKLNKQTQFHTVLLCLYVADPATVLASNSDLGPCFPLRSPCLFSYGRIKNVSAFVIKKILVCISSPKLHSAPLN